MRFSEALQNVEAAATKGPRCGVVKVFATLDKVDAAALQQALESSAPHAFIAEALAAIGVKVPAQTLSRHRRGLCSCG